MLSLILCKLDGNTVSKTDTVVFLMLDEKVKLRNCLSSEFMVSATKLE